MKTDREMWSEFMAASDEQENKALYFDKHAASKVELLSQALKSSGERHAALRYLARRSDDSLKVLDELLWLSVSHSMAGQVRAVLQRIPPVSLYPLLDEKIPRLLDEIDSDDEAYDDYRRHAELLAMLGHWSLLAKMVDRAGRHSDEDVREVADDYLRYRSLAE